MHTVSSEQLPPVPKRSLKPWLTTEAFALIDQRVFARQCEDYEEEKLLTRLLKRQIKADKTVWLKSLAATGSWEDLKKLRHPRRPQQGRLENSAGVLVDSDARADTLSLYLEEVQWAVRPCNLIGGRAPIWDLLLVECGPITPNEIKQVINKLKYKKTGGHDGILPEHLKVLVSTPAGLQILVQLCDICWSCHDTHEKKNKSKKGTHQNVEITGLFLCFVWDTKS